MKNKTSLESDNLKENNIVKTNDEEYLLQFNSKDNDEILKLCVDGSIFIKGKLIGNDIEVIDALREFLISQGFLHLK